MTTVHVSNLAPETTKEHLTEFFKFCGEIEGVDFKGLEGASTITFKNKEAAHTALIFSGHELDGKAITVTSDEGLEGHETQHVDGEPFTQSDKPRAGIAAEYLAKGYILSDQILTRAIELDKQKGISTRFLQYFNGLDHSIGERVLGHEKTVSGHVHGLATTATDRAKALDEQKGYSKIFADYYKRAAAHPLARKFYLEPTKYVQDIHTEASRILEAHKSSTSTSAEQPPVAPPVLESSANPSDPPAPASGGSDGKSA